MANETTTETTAESVLPTSKATTEQPLGTTIDRSAQTASLRGTTVDKKTKIKRINR